MFCCVWLCVFVVVWLMFVLCAVGPLAWNVKCCVVDLGFGFTELRLNHGGPNSPFGRCCVCGVVFGCVLLLLCCLCFCCLLWSHGFGMSSVVLLMWVWSCESCGLNMLVQIPPLDCVLCVVLWFAWCVLI